MAVDLRELLQQLQRVRAQSDAVLSDPAELAAADQEYAAEFRDDDAAEPRDDDVPSQTGGAASAAWATAALLAMTLTGAIKVLR